MQKFDSHCDVLWKMWESEGKLSFYTPSDDLHVQYKHLIKNEIKVQAFAIFIPSNVPVPNRFNTALDMIDLFYEKIIQDQSRVRLITSSEDLKNMKEKKDSVPGALLTLEGAEALQGSLTHLRTLYRLGVRSLGLTWNWRNEAADGVEEPDPGGLSSFGIELVREADRLGMIIDVSHLSEKGFWDLVDKFQTPVIASHSNCKKVCHHQRNLTDEQIKTIIQLGGTIGVTFVPQFVSNKKQVNINDLLHHVEHICSLGGENHLGFGSDFDGITHTMDDLTHTGKYNLLEEELLKHYPEQLVKNILFDNWAKLYQQKLPSVSF